MYFEDDPNQNSTENIKQQNEKTENSDIEIKPEENQTGKKRKVLKQIKAPEKKEIKLALKDQLPSKKPTRAKAKKVIPDKQIDQKTRSEIVNLLRDEYEKPTPAKKKATVKTKPKKQILPDERQEIIKLLSGGFQSGETEETQEEEEIDYSDFNKQELVEILEETVLEKDISLIRTKIGKINKAFHKLNREDKENALQDFVAKGGEKDDFQSVEDPLEKRFKAAFNTYKHNKSKYTEELELQKQDNLKKKNDILDELKKLIDSEETLKKTYDEFNLLQDRWKEIGMVPAGELNNLWQNYHFLVEMFFDKVRINKELRDLDLKKNFEKKIALCEKAEELLLEKSIIKSFKLLQQFHDEWREIGPVPSENREELWQRFKSATDKINSRRKEHYKERQAEQEKNYEAKVALCEKAEEMLPQEELSVKDWQKKTDQINELFKVWKTIGRAPKNKNDEVWVRFKSSLDGFFKAKRSFLNKLKDQQTNNLNLKIDLCIRAEAIKDSTDWKTTTNQLISLQKEWKKIGPVPRRQSDKIWKRFRAACDEFFERKSGHFKNIRGEEQENLNEKKKLVEEILSYKVSKNKEDNLNALKELQRKWIEIGHVPFKEKDDIQKKYREAIDGLVEKMEINKNELSQSGFKSKLEMLKDDPDKEWKLKKERNFLLNKINKIKEDVALWENNIGFFSTSKQSDKLKQEFELKIEKAKKEIRSYEDRIKLLNNSY